jgi:hypothetical protein
MCLCASLFLYCSVIRRGFEGGSRERERAFCLMGQELGKSD